MRKLLSFFVVCVLFFSVFSTLKAGQENIKKIDLRSLDKVLAEKGQTVLDPEIKLKYGNIIRKMSLEGISVKKVDSEDRFAKKRLSLDKVSVVEAGHLGLLYLDGNDYKYKKLNKTEKKETDISIFAGLLAFVLFLIYYLLDNNLKKQDKETHNAFLIILIFGGLCIVTSLSFALINNLFYSSILGIVSIVVTYRTWIKDSWLLFIFNILVVIGFILSLYFLK